MNNKHFKFWIIAGIIIIVSVGVTYFLMRKPITYTSLDKVTRKNIVEEIKVTGKIKSAENADISFERSGKISSVKVQIGDRVKAGQVLLTLENSDLVAQVAQAQAVLNKQMAGNTTDYIAQMQANLDKAQNDLMQISGEQTGAENSKLVQNSYDDIFAGLQSVQNILDTSLITADDILGITNEMSNDNFENYLSALDSSKKTIAEDNYIKTEELLKKFNIFFNSITNTKDHQGIDEAAKKAQEVLLQEKNMLFSISQMLEMTSPIGTISQNSLDGMKSSILNARNNITGKYSSLLTQIHAIETSRTNYASYATLLEKAQAALNDAKNPPRDVDIAGTKASLALAQATYNKTILTAPFDGVVSKQEAKLGTIIAPTIPIISIINDNKYQIETYIAQSDLAKLHINDKAEITLDSLGSDMILQAQVIRINPAGEILSDGNIAYKIVLQFTEENTQIKDGLTANIKITTAQKENVLVVPEHDIIQKNNKYFVFVVEGRKNKEQAIEIGIKSADGYREIISGLQENQNILSYGNI